jgi:DNA-binding transcriptional LysR family regulator
MPRMPSLASIEEAATEVAGTAAAVSGRLRVNVDPWFARMVLAPRLRRFLIQYPLLSVELTVSNHREEMMDGSRCGGPFRATGWCLSHRTQTA